MSTGLTRRSFLRFGLFSSLASALVAHFGNRLRPAEAAEDRFVDFRLSGGLTATTVTIVAKLNRDKTAVRVAYSTQANLSNPSFSAPRAADVDLNHRLLRFQLTNLSPNTQYYYSFEADGLIDAHIGRFRTPTTGPFSFTFAFASCARTGSDDPAFTAIRNLNPLFFMHMGDLHYVNISVNDINYFRNTYDYVFTSPGQYELYRDVPLAYMWDDHDYGDNNADKSSPSRTAARLAYQEYLPHYPLAAGSGHVAPYQAFTIGRVRFIMTDTRSERDSVTVPSDNPNKTMLGAAQKAWLKQQLLNARDNQALTVWMCTTPWLADPPGAGPDNWSGFTAERRELADFIQANNITNLIYISGDVHMLAIDDGSNNRYATNGAPGFVIMQAAAMDQSESFFTSNTYSEGQFPGRNQFGVMTITDNGGPILQVKLSGRNVFSGERVSLDLSFTASLSEKTYLPHI